MRMRRLGHAVALAIALASCGGHVAERRDDGGARDAPEVVDLVLTPRVGDVFAFGVDVQGEIAAVATPDVPRLLSCSMRVLRGADGEHGATEVPVVLAPPHAFSARVPLAEGENLVDVACRDSERVVHRAPRARFVERRADVPEPQVTKAPPDASLALVLDASASRPSAGSRAPVVAWQWSGVASGEGPRVTVHAPGLVRLRVVDARGRAAEAAVRVVATPEGLTMQDGAAKRTGEGPGLVYGVYPPLYGTPPLAALASRLPALADLGVDVVWVTPPYASPRGDFGYAVTNHFRVRAELGTEEDLAALVERGHQLGLRVVLDFVPNHTSDRHPWFADASRLGAGAHGQRFYAHDAEGRPTHYFDWKNLPNLAYDEPEVRALVTDASRHWMRRTGVDGFRVDAIWGLEQRAPDFVPAWARAVRAENPDALLVAEASARDPFWLASGFDAAYDWTDELGHWAWEHVWDEATGIPDRLDAALASSRERTPGAAQQRVLRFLDNNDTGARFVTRHGPGMTRAALAALFTLPGTPLLFSGSETGAEYEPYGAGRPVLTDADPHGLRALVKELVTLRRTHAALRSEHMSRIVARDARTNEVASDVYAYARRDAATGEVVLVAVRFGPGTGAVRLETPTLGRHARRGVLRELRSGRPARSEGRDVRVDLGAWDVALVAAP